MTIMLSNTGTETSANVDKQHLESDEIVMLKQFSSMGVT